MGEERKKTFVCLQPEYVGEFRCDGSACGSKCCKGWAVDIDGPTYQKYCTIEPKNERKKIVSRIKFKKQRGQFFVEMTKDETCPFLQSDGLCRIQKTWGEEWLSNTCTIYPRTLYTAGDVMLRGLTLTCPVAAKLALLPKEKMVFRRLEISEEEWVRLEKRNAGRMARVGDALLDIQYGAIPILQNRALSIDQRLIVLGFFIDQIGDFVETGELEKIETLSAVYTADDFMEHVPELLQAITFRPEEYVKSMFGLIEALYGKGAMFSGMEKSLMHHVVRTFGLEKTEVPLSVLVETYHDTFYPAMKRMLREYGHVFENYLVHDFFLSHYPQTIQGNVVQNYSLFVMTYKLVEFMAVSLFVTEEKEMDEERLVDLIGHMATSFDHNTAFLQSVANDTLKRQKDVVSCMKNLLYAGEEYSA